MPDPRRFEWLLRPRVRDEDLPVSAEARFVDAFVELPAAERSAFALSEIGGLEADEIAQRLGTDSDTAERLVARARESIRVALAERGRRLLGALVPFQNGWQSLLQTGTAAPAVRVAGAVAVAIAGVATTTGATSAPQLSGPDARELAPAAAGVRVVAAAPRPRAKSPSASAAPALSVTPAAAIPIEPATPTPAPVVPVRTTEPAGASPPAPPRPAPAPSARERHRSPRLGLVGIPPVPGRQIREDDVDRPVLHLPDVAELVRDEVDGGVGAAEQDRPDERVPVIAAEPGQTEEPRRDDDADALDPNGSGIEVERVEPRLGAEQPLVRTPSVG